ncbi:hypothetical protein ACSV4D_16610 [Flavobacterium sp. ARAG 55.4]|uniref:hypothetical protein n=1 Tax=Flavobacterium sp. ARAG 55.4 TaxID=3451357 RepID=UPI003F474095
MKFIINLLFFLIFAVNIWAQSPEKISYQAIIRGQDNSLIVNSKISLSIIIHQNSSKGTTVFQETHTVYTNNNGLISVEIGTGNNISGSFANIPWERGPFFIETQVDASGGTNYNLIGVTQLLSVPYALHAKTAERLISTDNINPYKAKIVIFNSSRNVADSDINNTIECTSSATLTLTNGFENMLNGDTINLEAHNGAVLTIQASPGVQINYNENGKAVFSSSTGNVRFGFLRKTDSNSYIISGQ